MMNLAKTKARSDNTGTLIGQLRKILLAALAAALLPLAALTDTVATGLEVKYYDISSSGYSTWTQSEASMTNYFAGRTPTLEASTADWGDTLTSGFVNSELENYYESSRIAAGLAPLGRNNCRFHGKYASGAQSSFATFMTGFLMVETTGSYSFGVLADDYIVVYIDGQKICAARWQDYGIGSVQLARGQHRICIAHYENTGGQGLSVQWKKPGDASYAHIPKAVLSHGSLEAEVISKALATGSKPVPLLPVIGSVEWTVVDDSSLADGSCIRSGETGAGETSSVETSLVGPGALSFDWRISANRGDYCRFYLDGAEQKAITRSTDWATVTVAIPVGEHVARWSYVRGSGSATGEDAAFLDNVDWRPQVSLSVSSAYGDVSPAPGTVEHVYGDVIRASASAPPSSGGTRQVCAGWLGAGSVPASGTATNIEFAIQEDSTLIWNWRTEHWTAVSVTGGMADFTSHWVADGENVSINLSPANHLYDISVSGDTTGVTLLGTRLSFAADRPRSITVKITEVKLSLSVFSEHGTTLPAKGVQNLSWGTDVAASVAASDPEDGIQYLCTGWTGTGSVPKTGATNVVSFTMEEASSITWNWRTNVWISLASTGPVATDFPAGWAEKGGTIQVTFDSLVPYAVFSLGGDADGVVLDANGKTLTIPADRPRNVTLAATELTLPSALDTRGIRWTTEGVPWFPQTAESADGEDAAQSGRALGDEVSALETTFSGPGTFSWSWRIASSGNAGVDVFLDGELLVGYVPTGDWTRETLQVSGNGSHVLRFEFWNMGFGNDILDCVWIDKVSWSGTLSSVTVTLDARGGTVTPATVQRTISDPLGELPVPVMSDCEFLGWYTDLEGGVNVTADTAAPRTNTTIYAHWLPSFAYTVSNGEASLGGGDASSAAINRAFAGKVTIPATLGGCPVTGIGDYAFYDCSRITSIAIPDSVTSIGCFAFAGCSALEELTIPAWFLPISDDWGLGDGCDVVGSSTSQYRVEFDANGGSGGMANQIIPLETPTTLNPNAFLRTGYVFAGWAMTKNADISYQDGQSVENLAAGGTTVTLYAKWTPITYTVSFNANGGEGEMDNQLFTYDVQAPLSANRFTRREFVFDGWAVEPEGEAIYADGETILNLAGTEGIITLYAKWSSPFLYTVMNGEATITGIKRGVYEEYVEVGIVIPTTLDGYPITSIGDKAFSSKGWLASVTIPNSVVNIGEHAFEFCEHLESVTIGNSVKSIGDGAFWGCRYLRSIHITDMAAWCGISFSTASAHPLYWSGSGNLYLNGEAVFDLVIPDSVTSIGSYAFYNCDGLMSVTIGNSVKSIGDCAFYNCDGLMSVTIGNSVKSIGNAAFYCSSLTSVHIADIAAWCGISFSTASAHPLYWSGSGNLYLNGEAVFDLVIPDSVTSIGSYAFYNCDGLTSVTMPNSVKSIEDGAFENCDGLTSVTIGNGVTSIGGSTFEYCSGLTSVTIPNSVTSIGGSAFKSCIALTSVTIGNGVTSIGGSAFENCSGLTSVMIGNAVTSIGNEAFEYCSSLTSVTIPNSVTNIGKAAFASCSSLKSMTIGDGMTSISREAFYSRREEHGLVYFSYTTLGAIMEFRVGRNNPVYSSRNGLLLSKDGKNLILGVNGDVVIPNSVTDIGDDAFANCDGLRSVTIPNSVKCIGENAFWYCSDLRSVTIPNSVTSIGDCAFYNCDGLTSVTIPNSVTRIGWGMFYCCSSLTSMTIPDSVTDIGDYAFCGCDGLTSVTIPDSVTVIGDNAFSSCSGLTSVTIPDSVWYIGEGAFWRCDGLTVVIIPSSVSDIGYMAFGNCSNLRTVYAPEGLRDQIGSELVFSHCYTTGPVNYYSTDRPLYVWFTTTFDANGGTGGWTKRLTYGSTLSAPAVTRTGHSFRSWSPAVPATVPCGDATYKAQWAVNTYTVRFDANGGTGGWTRSLAYGSALSAPSVTRTGYIFTGWSPAVPATVPAGNATYVARWMPGPYTVVFNANGGKGTMAVQTIPYGTTAKLRANAFARSGSVFIGWAKSPTGPVVYANEQSVLNLRADGGTIALYAVWVKKSYKVAFNANGGTGRMAVQKMTYGRTAKLRKNAFRRKGWIFIGWATSKAGAKRGVIAYANAQSVLNLRADGGKTTLYAVWAKKTYKVKFNANGGTGRMAVQTFTYGKAKKLSANKFKKKNRVFRGWAKSAALAKKGNVAYKNRQAVKNLILTGKTVKLYAVWGGIPRPSNDNLSNAINIVVDLSQYPNYTDHTIRGTNKNATLQGGEPVHGTDPGSYATTSQASVWYRWKAPYDGQFYLYSPPGSGRRRIGVYTGHSISTLYKVGESHEQWGGYTGSYHDLTGHIKATAGTTYYIAIASGKDRTTGPFSITLYYWNIQYW